jgi:outer membrane lipoprotein carrier protein
VRPEGGALALGLAVLSGPAVRQAADPWPILDRASAAYTAHATLTADFVQVVTNPLLGAPDTTRGRLFLRRPDRFALRFSDPAGDRIVADGTRLWLYTPSTTPGQVIRSAIPDMGGTGPNLIGQFLERPRERYRATVVGADSLASGWADVVALAPFIESAPYRDARVWVSRADGLVRRIEIVEASGQTRVFALDRVRPGGAVPRREVTFVPPAGARVVDQ